MEVKIGVINANRELIIDTDLDADAVESAVREALGNGGALALADARGRRVVIPVEKLGYVEIAHSTTGQVGFRS